MILVNVGRLCRLLEIRRSPGDFVLLLVVLRAQLVLAAKGETSDGVVEAG